MSMRINVLSLLLFVTLVFQSGLAFADDWLSLRGNDGLGKSEGTTLLSRSKKVGLKVRWKKKIGSGYSSVVIADGMALTMFTDGKDDKLACLKTADGKQLWEQTLEPMFKGSNGSFDGPVATPVVHGGQVFALTARGKLFSFELKTGKQRWMRDLAKEEEAVQPMYGFSTTPLVVGKTLCVLAGAKKGALIGIDVMNGATKWHAGKGQISSQIPVLVRLDGQEMVLTGAGRNVIGVDPSNGKLLLEFAHQGTNGSAMMPVPFDGDKILLTNDDSFSKAFQIKAGESTFEASEVWSDRSIKNTYNVPVNLENHFFGYSTRILTCVDEKSGKPKWKSRKPGDGFLIVVDGHLVIVTKKGSVHVAKADTKKYQELASVKVFEDLVWAIPAYSENAVFIRSFAEIACVEFVNENSAKLTGAQKKLPMSKSFGDFLQKVTDAKDNQARQRLVDTLLENQSQFPIVEDGIAHFVFRGEATDVALACDVFGARQEEKMIHVDGTNLFYYTLKLPADQRVSYIFLKDFKPQTDPLNSRKMTSSMYAGEMEFAIRLQNEKPLEMSWFGMSKWQRPQWMNLHRKERLAGKILEKKIKLEGDSSFDFDVYLPPSYAKESDRRFPVLYVHNGEQAKQLGELDEVADLYFQSHPEKSAIVVFLKSSPTTQLPAYLKQIAEKVVPFVDKEYRTIAKREARGSFGAGFASGFSLGLGTMHADLFGACSAQSPLVFDQARGMVINGFKGVSQPTRLYLEWGRFDMHNPVENWDVRDMAKAMKQEISSNEKIQFLGGEVNDSTDWASWKYRFGRIVSEMFSP